MILIQRLLQEESAQSMTEYAILIGTFALATVVVVAAMGTRLRDVFQSLQTEINKVPAN